MGHLQECFVFLIVWLGLWIRFQPFYVRVIRHEFFISINVNGVYVRFKQEFIFIYELIVTFVKVLVTFKLSFA